MNRKEYNDKIMGEFADKLISRLETMKKEGWQMGWIPATFNSLPQNWNGRPYGGANHFFLLLHSAMNEYKTPVYITMNQLQDINKAIFKDEMVNGFVPKDRWNEAARIKKGEEAMKIIFWDVRFSYENGKRIGDKDAESMDLKRKSREELKQMGIESHAILRSYAVFNIDQTTINEVLPKKYEEVLRKMKPDVVNDESGMYKSPSLDRMLERQEWECPINYQKPSNSAFYSPQGDFITVPMKGQFARHSDSEGRHADGMEFYASLIHEMAHSTGHPSRLNRKSDTYDREELVAEMTAAVIGSSMGFDTKSVIKNNEEYLSSWIDHLNEKPEYIRTIISDVTKACNAIITVVDKQRIELGQSPLLYQDKEKPSVQETATQQTASVPEKTGKEKSATVADDKALPVELAKNHQMDKFLIFKGFNNSFKLTVSVNGEALLPKTISVSDKKKFDQGIITRKDLTLKYYGDEIYNVGHKRPERISKSRSW